MQLTFNSEELEAIYVALDKIRPECKHTGQLALVCDMADVIKEYLRSPEVKDDKK